MKQKAQFCVSGWKDKILEKKDEGMKTQFPYY